MERVIIGQLLNPIVWLVLLFCGFMEYLISKAPTLYPKLPEAEILVRELLVVEGALAVSSVAVLVWEGRLRQRAGSDKRPPAISVDAVGVWIACSLIVSMVALLLLVMLLFLDFPHILTLLQRSLFLLLTVLLIPLVYLIVNPRMQGGLICAFGFLAGFLIYFGFQILIVYVSSLGDETSFFARLNDVYSWNYFFPKLARSELWLTIYQPWFGWYLLIYILVIAIFLSALIVRERKFAWRNK